MKCQECKISEAVALGKCESCIEGLLENYVATEIEQAERIEGLEAELDAANKRNIGLQESLAMTGSLLVEIEERLEKEIKKNRWTPVGERLPEEYQYVIVSGGPAQYRGGKWFSGAEQPAYGRKIQWEVTHWKPYSVLVPTDEAKADKEYVDFSKVKSVSFLPDCDYRRQVRNVGMCHNVHSVHVNQPCSKRCVFEPKVKRCTEAEEFCEWTYSEDADCYKTSCGHDWKYIMDDMEDKKINACPYCGFEIKESEADND